MYNLSILTKHQTKILFRNAKSTIPGFLMPVMMFLIFGTLLGDFTVDDTGRSLTDYLVPAYCIIVILNAVITIYGQYLVLYTEKGNMTKYQLLGVSPLQVSIAIFLATLLFQLVAIILLIMTAYLSKGVTFPWMQLPSIILGFILINAFAFATVVLLSAIIKKTTTYQSIAMILFFFQMFLGGLSFPPEMFPETLTTILLFTNPIIHALKMYRGVWITNQSIFSYGKEVLILILITGLFLILARYMQSKKKSNPVI